MRRLVEVFFLVLLLFQPSFGGRLLSSSLCLFSAGGFGKKTQTRKPNNKKKSSSLPSSSEQLTPLAKELLEKHQHNVDAASSDYFQSQMQTMKINKLSTSELHRARLEAAWDTVALFLPYDYARSSGKVDAFVERRLSYIAKSVAGDVVVGSTTNPKKISLLDVGCGDGAILPYLDRTRVSSYLGIDVSTKMIELGRKRHPDDTFLVGCFPQDVPADQKFDCILFNGSLQFFSDTLQTLAEARQLLATTPSSNNGFTPPRIILSHVMGSKFVMNECRTNPTVALRPMPDESALERMAQQLGMKLLKKEDLIDEPLRQSDASDLNFYLAALSLQ